MDKEEIKEYIKRRIKNCLENMNICYENEFDEEAEYLKTEQKYLENILKVLDKEKEIDLTTVYIKGIQDEKEKWRKKIRDRVEELKDMQKENADEIKRNIRFYSIYDSYNLQINELLDLLEEE